MTDDKPEQPGKAKRPVPPIGGIQQQEKYATIGGKKHSEVQTNRLSDVQSVKMSEVEQSKSPNKEDTSMPAVETAKTPNVKKSKHPGWKQQTVYLPPSLIKRLKKQAAEEDRELSNVTAQAIEEYLDHHGDE